MALSKRILLLILLLTKLNCFCQSISSKSNKVSIDTKKNKSNDTLTAPTIKWDNPKEEIVTLKDGKFLLGFEVTSKSKLKSLVINLKEKQNDEDIFLRKLESGISDVNRTSLRVDKTFILDKGINIIEVEAENADGIKSISSKLAYVNVEVEKERKSNEKLKPTITSQNGPITLHSANPHYFQYQNKATILIGSSEHYGAIVNKGFDYNKYLETLAKDGLNYVRIYGGTYVEKVGDFGIQRNTLAPSVTNLLLPWKRSDSTGYFLGGNKFDITQWDDNYFTRLKDFLSAAKEKNIIVELALFSSFYGSGWKYTPLNPSNNINKTDNIPHDYIHTLKNGNILQEQEKYVRKIVKEINEFDNFYFEIQNEPWADQIDTIFVTNEYDLDKKWTSSLQVVSSQSKEWQEKVAQWIRDEEKSMTNKHLISEDISNFSYPISEPSPNVDVFNFHYANKQAVQLNYYLNKPIGFNETGFSGNADITYRRQAWRFLMEGGSIFNQLDFSFAVGRETGYDSTYKSPGGGSIPLRRQLGLLKSFFEKFDFAQLHPDRNLLIATPAYYAQAIGNGKDMWMVYLESLSTKSNALKLSLKNDKKYEVEWFDVTKGILLEKNQFDGNTLMVPSLKQDKIAIIRAIK